MRRRDLRAYELGSMLSILLSGGIDTTMSALGSAFIHLGRNSGLRDILIANPSMIPSFVEEVFRMWPPVMVFPRVVKKPRALGGRQLEVGELIYLSIAGANRDPEEFEDPDAFKYDRAPNRHMTFSVGSHRCVGSSLARLEMRVALEEVLRRMPDYQLIEEEVEITPHFANMYTHRRIGASFAPGKREMA